MNMKYKDLSKEQKIYIVYQTLLAYVDDYLADPNRFNSQRTNQLLKVILKLLKDINIFNKTIRHIDWNNPRRYIGAMVRILRKVVKKYPNCKDTVTYHKELLHITIKNLILD
jgi:hypothetical protein